MAEVRNSLEGSLRWVQSSGLGLTWATASAPASGLLGYVTNMTFTSAQDVQQISDRGVPKMHKLVAVTPISLQFDLQWGVTADYPTRISSSGVSVPALHFEIRSQASELATSSAIYHQFLGVSINSKAFTETTPANTMSFQGVALAMIGPTASGYLG